MPVGFLSDAELAPLSSWPDEIADDDLVIYFTLTNDDLGWLTSNARADSRLGAALGSHRAPAAGRQHLQPRRRCPARRGRGATSAKRHRAHNRPGRGDNRRRDVVRTGPLARVPRIHPRARPRHRLPPLLGTQRVVRGARLRSGNVWCPARPATPTRPRCSSPSRPGSRSATTSGPSPEPTPIRHGSCNGWRRNCTPPSRIWSDCSPTRRARAWLASVRTTIWLCRRCPPSRFRPKPRRSPRRSLPGCRRSTCLRW